MHILIQCNFTVKDVVTKSSYVYKAITLLRGDSESDLKRKLLQFSFEDFHKKEENKLKRSARLMYRNKVIIEDRCSWCVGFRYRLMSYDRYKQLKIEEGMYEYVHDFNVHSLYPSSLAILLFNIKKFRRKSTALVTDVYSVRGVVPILYD